MTFVALDAVEVTSIAQFERASQHGRRPVLMRAGLASERSLAAWQLQALLARGADTWVRVHVQHRDFDVHAWTRDRRTYAARFPQRRMSIRRMKLGHFLDGLRSGRGGDLVRSIAGISIGELAPGRRPPVPAACRHLGCTAVTAWSASRGRRWSMHQDDCPVFMGLLFGAKRVAIAAPGAAPKLYVHERSPRLSSIPHVYELDKRRFPRAARARFLDAMLVPGDLLYVPPRWWHQVDYLEPSMSFSFWPP